MHIKLVRKLSFAVVLACGVLGSAVAGEPACSQAVCCSCAPAPGSTCAVNGKAVQGFMFNENMNNTCTYGSLHTMGTCAIGYQCPHNLYNSSSCSQACTN